MKQETKELLDYIISKFDKREATYDDMPATKIKKKCLCCGKEMELFPYEKQDFCDRCFLVVCQEVFNKANDGMTVREVRERIRRNVEND